RPRARVLRRPLPLRSGGKPDRSAGPARAPLRRPRADGPRRAREGPGIDPRPLLHARPAPVDGRPPAHGPLPQAEARARRAPELHPGDGVLWGLTVALSPPRFTIRVGKEA